MMITDDITMEEIMYQLEKEYGEDFNWRIVLPDKSKNFVDELKKELNENDPFLSNRVYAIAKCDSNDDVLFLAEDNKGSEIWRIYHLTYTVDHADDFPEYQEFNSRKTAADYIQNQYIAEYL